MTKKAWSMQDKIDDPTSQNDLAEVNSRVFRKRIESVTELPTSTGWEIVLTFADGSKLSFEADCPIIVK